MSPTRDGAPILAALLLSGPALAAEPVVLGFDEEPGHFVSVSAPVPGLAPDASAPCTCDHPAASCAAEQGQIWVTWTPTRPETWPHRGGEVARCAHAGSTIPVHATFSAPELPRAWRTGELLVQPLRVGTVLPGRRHEARVRLEVDSSLPGLQVHGDGPVHCEQTATGYYLHLVNPRSTAADGPVPCLTWDGGRLEVQVLWFLGSQLVLDGELIAGPAAELAGRARR